MRKAPGHQDPTWYPQGNAAWADAVGNRAADAAANAGVQLHRGDLELLEQMRVLALIGRAAVEIGTKVWPEWPGFAVRTGTERRFPT